MNEISAEKVWSLSDKELLSLLDSGKLVQTTRKVKFYVPSFAFQKTSSSRSSEGRFPTISVTGNECALGCKHCGRKLLKTMVPARTPTKLFEIAQKLKREGAVGCLVSGGCLPNGSVPLERFAPVIGRIKRELGLTVIVHTGIVSGSTAEALKDSGIDAALIDIIGSDLTIRQVCNLNVTVDDFENSLTMLHETGLNVVPHVIVGLQNGMLEGEFQALKMVKRHDPSALVIIAFMPIHGTEMENTKPPSPIAIAKVVAAARLFFPEVPLALGCMRPKRKHRVQTDVLALKAGADAIAFPSEEAIRYAQEKGFDVAFSPYCCSQIYVDIGKHCSKRFEVSF
jgi:uncharacterized radical SAM superfamily protein